jgi:hypothetical protein
VSTGTGQPPEGTPGPSGDDDMSLESVFNAVDTNQDGKISKDEYAAIWKDKDDLDKKFAFFDRDGSGYIEKAEYLGLRDKFKEGMGQDEPGQSGQSQDESGHLDPVVLRKAIDALPEWPQIHQLVGESKYDEADKIVKGLGFENWTVLNFYYSVGFTVAQAVQENPDAKNDFVPIFGQAAVDLITQPENMAKIMQYVPR